MSKVCRLVGCSAVVCLLAAVALAQAPDNIVANQNRTPAGKLENGVLTVQLELCSGAWHPEAEDGPQLFVQAFGEAGHAAQIPGPLLRMPEGTTVHATVTNKLAMKATVYGLNTRPGDATGVEIAAGGSHEFTFAAGKPGTYYYWARTTQPFKFAGQTVVQPVYVDAHLNGAFIVDPPGQVVPDRIFVVNLMFVAPDVVQPGFEVVTINGKSYPYTEPLEYTAGDSIRWRVINPSFAEHPMHLHGAFYKVLSLGNSESDTAYAPGERQSVVTQDLHGGSTMMLEWRPEHAGRWLFHCHFHFHMSPDERLPVFSRVAAEEYGQSDAVKPVLARHQAMGTMGNMQDMAGLVLVINVKRSPSLTERDPARAPRKLDLVVEPNAAGGNARTFSCEVREGKKIVVSQDKSVGPPIILTRGEPVEITVLNHLNAPTSIHWHGLELESYYDGVVGAGVGDQVTPAIQPGQSFIARFTPEHAGTFIYHTHAADPKQLSGGIYGALIVLEPGQSYDPEHDRLLVIGTRDTFFTAKRITVNGAEQFSPMLLNRGTNYRLRVINMAPNLAADLRLGSDQRPLIWREIAKDGANVPTRLAQPEQAELHIASGETYDFEFQPQSTGEIPLQVENSLNKAKLVGKIIVR